MIIVASKASIERTSTIAFRSNWLEFSPAAVVGGLADLLNGHTGERQAPGR